MTPLLTFFRVRLALLLLGVCLAGAGCTSPVRPATIKAEPSTALSDTAGTSLGSTLAVLFPSPTGPSLFYPLELGPEAFVARIGIARAAERTLDVQYYMIHNDATGLALFRECLHAADRGVRVRLLIDDIHTMGEDELLAALDAHPHMEVRIFNRFRHRGARWMDFLTDYRRVNRRMHNKSMTADNQLTIVGGRNVGDEYFAASAELDFSDLDALAAGPVVADVSAEFDRYWNSGVVWPVSAVVDTMPDATAVRSQYDLLEQSVAVESQSTYAQSLHNLELLSAIKERRLTSFRGTCQVIADPPEKITQSGADSAHAVLQLKEIMGQAREEILLVSPYFVPGSDGTAWLVAQAQRGIKVRILTNSYLATDVGAVHSGYMSYRPKLLAAGIEIYELKPAVYKEPAAEAEKGEGKGSRASLHAKNYLMDGKTIFIGSLNLDPRSARINTEMGLVIHSPALAKVFIDDFDARILDLAYRVERQSDGRTTWTTREGIKEVVVDSEPGMKPMKRFGMFLARILPVEEQL